MFEVKTYRGCLYSFFWSLNFHHSSLITYNSSLITHHLKHHVCLAPSLTSHHSIFFTLFVGPIPITGADFFFFQYPNSLNPVEKKKKKPDQTSEKKKKKKKKKRTAANPGKEKKKKKKKKRTAANPGKEKKRMKANASPGKKKKKSQRQPRKKNKKIKSKGDQKLRL